MFKWLTQMMTKSINSWNKWKQLAAKKVLSRIHKKIKMEIQFYSNKIFKINSIKMKTIILNNKIF